MSSRPSYAKEHSSGSRGHLVDVEEITNYQRGLVDNASGKDIGQVHKQRLDSWRMYTRNIVQYPKAGEPEQVQHSFQTGAL